MNAIDPGEPLRVAVLNGETGTIPGPADSARLLRERGVPGHNIEWIDGDVGAAALTDGRHHLIHVWSPGPAALAAMPVARTAGLPVVATYTGAEHPVYGECRIVLSPSAAADEALASLGVPASRVRRWRPGVDHDLYNPARFNPDAMPAAGTGATARVNLLYVGPLDYQQGAGSLADAFLIAHDRDPRLHLVLAGSGPDEDLLRHHVGHTATFLGHLEGEPLAQAFASADLLVCPTTLDGCAHPILEAQASGLPVLAVGDGGAAELIEPGRSGCLVPPGTVALAEAIKWLARRATLRERLSTGGLLAVRDRTWERSLEQIARAWADALVGDPDQVAHAA
jgi:glycosyltransferase involved in cell wall biosynthesis